MFVCSDREQAIGHCEIERFLILLLALLKESENHCFFYELYATKWFVCDVAETTLTECMVVHKQRVEAFALLSIVLLVPFIYPSQCCDHCTHWVFAYAHSDAAHKLNGI